MTRKGFEKGVFEFRLREQRSPFALYVSAELDRARAKHPGEQHSAHEGFGVLYEEVWEFFGEVMSQTPKTDRGRAAKRAKMCAELVQIAAMAQRTAEDLGLVKDYLMPKPKRKGA